MVRRNYKHTARFESPVGTFKIKKKDEKITFGSFSDLSEIIPTDVAATSPDLFPIAGNMVVVNVANLNGALIDTEVAKGFYKSFVNKFVDVEHDHERVVGHITNSCFTSFDDKYKFGEGSSLIQEEEAPEKAPFNIAIGGVIYDSIASPVVDKLLECNDPEDKEMYCAASFSFECAYDNYGILLSSNGRLDDEDAEVITDPKQISKYEKYLLSNKGKGSIPDGRKASLLIQNTYLEDGSVDPCGVIAMGVGLTFQPASQVKGIITPAFKSLETASIQENSENKISQTENPPVTKSIMSLKTFTKLAEIEALDDVSAKEYSFANIQHVLKANMAEQINEAVTKASEQWSADVKKEKDARAQAEQKAQEALARVEALEAEVKKNKERADQLEAEHLAFAATQKFNERMQYFDENYDLTDSDRQALASRIKDLDDEGFTSFAEKEFAVFASAKKKSAKKDDKKDEKTPDKEPDGDKVEEEAKKKAKADDDGDEEMGKKTAKASVENKEETGDVLSLFKAALANVSANPAFPNSADASQSFKDKFASAFSVENITKK